RRRDPPGRPSATTLDRRTRIGLDRHSELLRRRIANHRLLEVERADGCIPVGNLRFLVPIGAFGLLLLVEDEHKTLHLNLHLSNRLALPPRLGLSAVWAVAVAASLQSRRAQAHGILGINPPGPRRALGAG